MSSASSAREGKRCAVHPARPARDGCPVCGRPRCLADGREYADRGCAACATEPARAAAPPRAELIVRGGLAGLAVVYLGGWIATQYVRVHLMSLAAPAVVGLAAAWVVPRAARGLTPRVLPWATAVLAALVGTALAFPLTPGGQNPLGRWDLVGGPYLAALVGVALGPLVFGRVGAPPAKTPDQPPGVDAAGAGEDVGTDL